MGFIALIAIKNWFSQLTEDINYEAEEKLHNAGFNSGLYDRMGEFTHGENFFQRLRYNMTQRDSSPLYKDDSENKRYEKYAKFGKKEDEKREKRYEQYANSKFNTPENDQA